MRAIVKCSLYLFFFLTAFCGSTLATGIVKLTPYDRATTEQVLQPELAAKQLRLGQPVYIRIFKEEAVLELWLRNSGGQYALFKRYGVCRYSGTLGPKEREGDNQAPEGFYSVGRGNLNPNSRFHLAFNLGYPNAYDRSLGRTGSALMVHGNCVSIGCYAMTDAQIEEIYTLMISALDHGQASIAVHIFPFEMTDAELAKRQASRWHSFWQELQPAFRFFKQTGTVPSVTVRDKHYIVAPAPNLP